MIKDDFNFDGEYLQMSEMMNEDTGDAIPSPEKEGAVNAGDANSSFEEELNSAFKTLEAMQEEIMEKKLVDLEERLWELETIANDIIKRRCPFTPR